MARQTLTKTTVPGPNPSAGAVVTMTAANTSDKEQYTIADGDVIVVQNTSADTSYTYTVTSVADPYGRTGDITANAIAAGAIEVLRVGIEGWKQTNGYVYLEANNTAVKFGVLTGLR